MPDRRETSTRTGFNANDLATLASEEPGVAVSMFLPTHTSGKETRQDPIRLENLIRKLAPLGSRLVAVIDINPEALSDDELHSAAYAEVEPRLAAGLDLLLDRMSSALAAGDGRAAVDVHEVVRAASQGRVDTLLVVEDDVVKEHYDEAADQFREAATDGGVAANLLETAVRCSLRQGVTSAWSRRTGYPTAPRPPRSCGSDGSLRVVQTNTAYGSPRHQASNRALPHWCRRPLPGVWGV